MTILERGLQILAANWRLIGRRPERRIFFWRFCGLGGYVPIWHAMCHMECGRSWVGRLQNAGGT